MTSNNNSSEEISRSIFLSGKIDECSCLTTNKRLVKLQEEDPLREITIIIDSYGGHVDSMFAITDLMDIIQCPIRTICIGKAMSAGAFIFTCGDKGRRFMTKNSRLMYHQISGGYRCTVIDVEIDVIETRRRQEIMVKEISEKSNLTEEQVKEMIDRDKYLSPEEAIEIGVCDEVISSFTMSR
jgi:ATP-dependent Clp protease protease subunit